MRNPINVITAGLLIVILIITNAHAGAFGTQTTCARYGGSISCKSEGYSMGYHGPVYRPSGIINVAPETEQEAREREERIRQWELFCQPTLSAPDANGVQRYIYVHVGCDTGRRQ